MACVRGQPLERGDWTLGAGPGGCWTGGRRLATRASGVRNAPQGLPPNGVTWGEWLKGSGPQFPHGQSGFNNSDDRTGPGTAPNTENGARLAVSSAEILAAPLPLLPLLLLNGGAQETEPGPETRSTGSGFCVFPIPTASSHLSLHTHPDLEESAPGRGPGLLDPVQAPNWELLCLYRCDRIPGKRIWRACPPWQAVHVPAGLPPPASVGRSWSVLLRGPRALAGTARGRR